MRPAGIPWEALIDTSNFLHAAAYVQETLLRKGSKALTVAGLIQQIEAEAAALRKGRRPRDSGPETGWRASRPVASLPICLSVPLPAG